VADFLIWATINQTAPREFAVTVSAAPDDPATAEGTTVDVRLFWSRELAVEGSAEWCSRWASACATVATAWSMSKTAEPAADSR
jgi:hypothetical protein